MINEEKEAGDRNSVQTTLDFLRQEERREESQVKQPENSGDMFGNRFPHNWHMCTQTHKSQKREKVNMTGAHTTEVEE